MKNSIAISADIGGSHITSCAFDLIGSCVIPETSCEMPVDNHGSANQIIAAWSKALEKTMELAGVQKPAGISFAMPGPFDYKNGISLIKGVNKFENLYGINVAEEIRKFFGFDHSVPVRFINDATAFALGEAMAGAGKSYKRMIALTLGTGFGSAYVENGLPVIEDDRVPKWGCLYHIPLNNQIADDHFSTRWFESEYYKRTGKKVIGVRPIAEAASHETIATEIFLDFGLNLGKFLSPWVNKFQAEAVILGGNISGAFDLFGQPLMNELKKENNVKIELSQLKEQAAIAGSAQLINDDYYKRIEPLLEKM